LIEIKKYGYAKTEFTKSKLLQNFKKSESSFMTATEISNNLGNVYHKSLGIALIQCGFMRISKYKIGYVYMIEKRNENR
jgi:hypothetical protein